MTWTIEHGDCLDVMRGMVDASVDAVVTDPPYGLGFMGKAWDATVPTAWAAEALRVLKPGGHLIAFGGTRTFHRLAVALEDSGFEIRDVLCWLYGSGFPKSLDVSKAIDKAAGVVREVVGPKMHGDGKPTHATSPEARAATAGRSQSGATVHAPETAPATAAARQWQGWGTALKPAVEFAILARKPLIGTVAGNVLQHGTGALNIDGCRIGTTKAVPASPSRVGSKGIYSDLNRMDGTESGFDASVGRWPANVVLDEAAAEVLDASVEPTRSTDAPRRIAARGVSVAKGAENAHTTTGHADPGGPSRFYYTPKASSSDRELEDGTRSTHPCVKPVSLMRWLVRLVTPPGGLVLDPFAGSGSTGVACIEEGFRFVGIEREAEYVAIARARLTAAGRQGRLDL